MSELIVLNDFSAGWTPSDDPINGRPNGLLKMDSLELSQNGAIRLGNGTGRFLSAFSNTLHSAFRKSIGGTLLTYSGDTSGLVFRGNTQIQSGGSTTRAAFNAAYNYVFGFSGDKRFKDDGSTSTDLGIIKPSAAPGAAAGAAGVLSGDYEYCQINVLVNGSYQAKSARSAISAVTLTTQVGTITPQNPSVPSSTANETWIFRRGGNLDQFYRIARVVTPFSAFSDNMSDNDALDLNITLNAYLLSVNVTDTPDAILACVGPVYGRMLYFTAKSVIASDIASPDSYDSRTVLGLGGASGSEIFKWAIKVARNVVLVGTDRDVYSLTGTFVQLPDGYLDISLLPLGVDYPSLSIDVALYKNSVVYMSKIGWVICSPDGVTIPLTPPNTDRLYSEDINDYGRIRIDSTGTTRYPCAIAKNKLYVVVPMTFTGPTYTTHIEIYDFIRRYWRPVPLSPLFLFSDEDNNLFGFDNVDKFLKAYDTPGTKVLDDGSSTKQTVSFRTTFQDDGKPLNLKDLFTLSIRGYTGSATIGLTVKIAFDGSTSFTTLTGAFVGSGMTEMFWDISGGIGDPGQQCKSIQVDLSGAPPDLLIDNISIVYMPRPLSQLKAHILDFGLESGKIYSISTLPFIIDTHSQNVDFYPVVDGVVGTKSTFNTSKKRTVAHYFTTIQNLTDLTGYFISAATVPFELYKVLPPKVDYVQPLRVKIAQTWVLELAGYGKLKQVEARIITPASLTSIPYSLVFDNGTPTTGTITVTASSEKIYSIPLPKTTAGSVLVITLGNTSITFSPVYVRAQVVKAGRDTELEWVTFQEGKLIG